MISLRCSGPAPRISEIVIQNPEGVKNPSAMDRFAARLSLVRLRQPRPTPPLMRFALHQNDGRYFPDSGLWINRYAG